MKNRPTAIMASTDRWASWIIDYLTALGVSVPNDMSVTGFDGSRLSAGLGITSVLQDFHQIGQLGAETLTKLIAGASIDDCQITYQCSIVDGKSTAAAPKRCD
jgi:DNA-binding LacI/PurR family transcriptional regulator